MPSNQLKDDKAQTGSDRQVLFQAQIVNSLGLAVIATDIKGNIVFWNEAAEKLYGWRSAEVIEKNIVEVTPTKESQQAASAILENLSKGESWSGEFEVQHKDGHWFVAEVTDSPVINQLGDFVGIVGVSKAVVRSSLRPEKEKENSTVA